MLPLDVECPLFLATSDTLSPWASLIGLHCSSKLTLRWYHFKNDSRLAPQQRALIWSKGVTHLCPIFGDPAAHSYFALPGPVSHIWIPPSKHLAPALCPLNFMAMSSCHHCCPGVYCVLFTFLLGSTQCTPTQSSISASSTSQLLVFGLWGS